MIVHLEIHFASPPVLGPVTDVYDMDGGMILEMDWPSEAMLPRPGDDLWLQVPWLDILDIDENDTPYNPETDEDLMTFVFGVVKVYHYPFDRIGPLTVLQVYNVTRDGESAWRWMAKTAKHPKTPWRLPAD